MECTQCFHTNLVSVFDRLPPERQRHAYPLHACVEYNHSTGQNNTHLYFQSHSALCDPLWGNEHTAKEVISEGFYDATGARITSDLDQVAAQCILDMLLSTGDRVLVHGSFVIHEYMRCRGMDPTFQYSDIDVVLLNCSSDNTKTMIKQYTRTAGLARLEVDVIRSRAKTWQEVLPGEDMSIGGIYLQHGDHDGLMQYEDTAWWFVGTRAASDDILARRATFYRDKEDESAYAVKSRMRLQKYMERGFAITNEPRVVDDSHLDMYYATKKDVMC